MDYENDKINSTGNQNQDDLDYWLSEQEFAEDINVPHKNN